MSQKVYVQNMRGKPLMPTKPAKARHLLKADKAEVVERKPFTIRLKYATGEHKQEVILGTDPGYSRIGFSAVTKKEELIAGVVRANSSMKAGFSYETQNTIHFIAHINFVYRRGHSSW